MQSVRSWWKTSALLYINRREDLADFLLFYTYRWSTNQLKISYHQEPFDIRRKVYCYILDYGFRKATPTAEISFEKSLPRVPTENDHWLLYDCLKRIMFPFSPFFAVFPISELFPGGFDGARGETGRGLPANRRVLSTSLCPDRPHRGEKQGHDERAQQSRRHERSQQSWRHERALQSWCHERSLQSRRLKTFNSHDYI